MKKKGILLISRKNSGIFGMLADFYPHRKSQHLPNGRNVNTEDILSCTFISFFLLSVSHSLSLSLCITRGADGAVVARS